MANYDDLREFLLVDHELVNSELYRALIQGNTERVVELCRRIPEGPLHVVSVEDDTVLHVACYSKQFKLVLQLLEIVRPDQHEKMTHRNKKGNTVLHEVAAFNKFEKAAKIMLQKAPELLAMHNNLGETALYVAVQYGKGMMFDFLDSEVRGRYQSMEDIRKMFYKNKDESSTILHAAVSAEQFELALLIANKDEYLIGLRDDDGRTALNLLASNSLAFQSRRRIYLRRFIYPLVSDKLSPDPEEVTLGWRVPWWEEIKKEARKYAFALALADILVPKDTSWKETDTVHEIRRSTGSGTSFYSVICETPLISAIKSGCLDIVEKILAMYPQAFEHVDNNGCTILHIAIKYRQMEVFEMVERMKFPMMRLIKKVDKCSNSILHMVGEKDEKNVLQGKMRSPALELHENLLLFERVKKIGSENYFKHVKLRRETAEELFARNNETLRQDAKEWLKGIAQNCSIVAVLISAIAFAAAYTVPGGPNQETGAPLLLNQPFIVIFTIADVLSLSCALTSIIIFLKILTYSFQLNDFKQPLPQQLMLGVSFLFFSVSMMTLAFAATIMLMMQNRQQGTKIALYIVASLPLPVGVFAISYMPLDFSLIKTVKKMAAFFPRYVCKSHTDPSREVDIQSSSSNHPPKSQGSSPRESQEAQPLV